MRPTALIIGESLGVRTTLAAALGHSCTVKVVRTVADGVGLFAASPPYIIIADVGAEKAAAESVFVKLRASFGGVPLLWIASQVSGPPMAKSVVLSFGHRCSTRGCSLKSPGWSS
jgi:hypothetical protein